MSQQPRNRNVRPVSNRPSQAQGSRPRNVNAPPPRDPFPFVMGGVIGALVVGLMVVVFLIGQNSSNPPSSSNPPASNPVTGGQATTAPVSGAAPPRIGLTEFKALYDSNTPPVVIDVRAKAAYDEGHIKGAISYPEAEVDSRSAELPKDRLIVAYCQ